MHKTHLDNKTHSVMNKPSHSSTTHFGYRDVNIADKENLVRDVFNRVARKYDLMNDLMSMGVHRLWKSTLIDLLQPKPDMSLIDVGGGTGDIAFGFLDHGGGPVSVVDINDEMLNAGRDRAIDQGRLDGLHWINGDAERLPVPDASFDIYTTAFCIRNVTRIEQALIEARRVLKPGGRFFCLEFSHVTHKALAKLYDAYSFNVLPCLGSAIANDKDAYVYLAESIRKFPDQQTFAQMINDAGLELVRVRNLSGGIAAIHSAWRI